jgi:hypothetical protein
MGKGQNRLEKMKREKYSEQGITVITTCYSLAQSFQKSIF